MNRGFEIKRDYIRKRQKKSWGWNKLCIWKKKKNDGFWMNRGFENIRDDIGKKAD